VFSQFADAQQIMKGTSYTESTRTGIQLAHLAGYSKPAEISKYLDLLTKSSFTIPGGLGEIAHSLKYSQNALATFGLNDQTEHGAEASHEATQHACARAEADKCAESA
jgi:hypothetical protein